MPQNNTAFAAAADFLERHSRFAIVSHARTDGDDLGSILALCSVIGGRGKHAVPIALGGVPPTLKFLPGQQDVVEVFDESDFDAIILSGCSQPARTGIPAIEKSTLPMLNIDHHPDNKMYGEVNLVDHTKSSVAELVFDFIRSMDEVVTPDISKALLTGIFTDTGSFMHSNTTSDALGAAAELMSTGARTDQIHSFTYKGKDLGAMKAWALAMENARIDLDNRIVISALSAEEMESIGTIPDDTFEGFTNFLSSVPEVRFAVFMRQDGEYIKGSIRSEEQGGFNVSKLAKLFGGGGHTQASGFTVKGKIVRTGDGWRIE